MTVDVALPKKAENGREVLEEAGRLRVAHPMACIEGCATATEQDFLWRYLEASDFASGQIRVYDEDGEPVGRYADYANRIDAQTYVRFEVSAYDWVRRYGLGREWATIGEMFIRMLSGRTETTFIDWGSYLTNSDNEAVAYGGAQISMRMLGLRLKDAYRDFFRWYETVRRAEEGGKQVSPKELLREMERDEMYKNWIEEFKSTRGVPG